MSGTQTRLRPFTDDGSKIHNIDESTPDYYGFVDVAGNWYILKIDGNSYTYAGSNNNSAYAPTTASYATAWTNRASLTYGYFSAAI